MFKVCLSEIGVSKRGIYLKAHQSEITEERTANGNMLKYRISEIERKLNAAYELMISPTECEPTQPKQPINDQNVTEESGYVTRNRDILEQPGSSHDAEIAEAIPFELDWDQGKFVT